MQKPLEIPTTLRTWDDGSELAKMGWREHEGGPRQGEAHMVRPDSIFSAATDERMPIGATEMQSPRWLILYH